MGLGDGNPRRRNRRSRPAVASSRPPAATAASSPPPAVDDGSRRRTGQPALLLEWLGDRYLASDPTNPPWLPGYDLVSASDPRRPGTSATGSDHPEAERTGSRARVRQSVLYSNRPRRSRPRRPSLQVEHPSEVSNRELEPEVTIVSTFEAPSVRETSIVSPSVAEERPSEVESSESGSAVTDLPALEALSLMNELPLFIPEEYYLSDKTSEDRDDDDVTTEYPSEGSRCELGRAVTDLRGLEALSLSDPPDLTPQTDEEYDSAVDGESLDDYTDFFRQHEPINFGIGTFGPETFSYSPPLPKSEWLGGARGQKTLEELAADTSYTQPDPSRLEALPASDSDYDMEEELRLLDAYLAASTPITSIRQGFDKLLAAEHAALTKLAAERGLEPPPPRQSKHFPVDRETQSLQTQQQPSSAAAQTQHSTAPGKPRCEASNAELVENAENWMREEVKILFEKYIETREDLKGLDWCFNELCHQCFNVESYNKIFHHYNFTVKMKKPNSVDWVDALYFAEVKQVFGSKYYFCCRLEPNENGNCYACKSQGVEDLQHPATGGFDSGSSNVGFGLWYE